MTPNNSRRLKQFTEDTGFPGHRRSSNFMFNRGFFKGLILALTLALSKTVIAFSGDEAQLRIRVELLGFDVVGSHNGIIDDSLQIWVTISGNLIFPELSCELTVENNTIIIRHIQTCALARITVEGENIDWLDMPDARISNVVVETNRTAGGSQSTISFDGRSFRYMTNDFNDWDENGVIRLRLESARPSFAVPALPIPLLFTGLLGMVFIGCRQRIQQKK